MGVPSDVPAPLAPLHQRFLAWRHACRKRSNCGEVRDRRLIPYVVEMGGVMAESRGESPRAWTYAEVELISPLRFAAEEAATFVEFWRRGLLCGVGFMHSAGGSAPATLAGVLALNCAENLFINLLYRLCYGWRKLWFQTNASVLDMRCGMFPFGRPERGLMTLAVGQVARHLDAGLWASAIYPDAKGLTCEAGLQSAFNVTPAILAGTLGIESFGLLSGGEMNSPLQLIIENEFAAGLKRFARGFEVTEETLALDVIREVGAGGMFLDTDHTLRHFRQEHWQPALFSRQPLNAWLASGRKTDVEAAREIWQFAQRAHDIPGMPDDAERRLLGIMEKAGRDLL
jgi:trimethylamine--corrinoid protein Co-methyltransferase